MEQFLTANYANLDQSFFFCVSVIKKKHEVIFICTMKTSKKFIVLQTYNKA